jgi:hypothetical protein
VAGPRWKLPSGSLTEGTYTWWYATVDQHKSPNTAVTIRFDNAAPTAQFFRVARTAHSDSAPSTPIEGVTIEGAKVSAAGQPVAVDGNGRFRASVTPLPGDDGIAVRLDHPRTGIHYYVRHASRAQGATLTSQ